jgi:glutamyl-tRNA reductase
VCHLFRLASGLESMVLGEDQIMGQIKLAFATATEAGMLGQVLNRLLTKALAAGKRVRTQTAIARTPVSVVSVALECARSSLGPLASQRVLILGTGRIAELALKHLRGDSPAAVGVVGRSPERLQALATAYGAQPWGFDQLDLALAEADVVISCTSAPGFVLGQAAVARALAGRPAPLLLLDMAVPRDVDPQVASLPGARLIGVDDLQAICAANREVRAVEVAHADRLVDDEVAHFMDWWKTQDVVPTIRALRERAEAIRADELAYTLARFPDLTASEQHAIRALSAAIINKLLHQPIAALKDPAGGDQLAPVVRQLFQLT